MRIPRIEAAAVLEAEPTDGRDSGRLILEPHDASRMQRVGIIDVGSNSVRLVVFDGAARSPAYFFNEKVHCALGASLGETGKLDRSGKRRALRAIRRFALLAEGMRLSSLTAVGTAAVRSSDDGHAFLREVEDSTGIRVHVANGEEEARLAAQGVFLGWPEAQGIVCDLGGSSTELIEVDHCRIGRSHSARFGHLELSRNTEGIHRHIRDQVAAIRRKMDGKYPTLFLVGGSWRMIARLDMERRNYPLRVLNEYRMTNASAAATVDWIHTVELPRLRELAAVSPERLQSLPAAGLLLKELIRQFEPGELGVSAYGIREGLLYERMPEQLRRKDPLIEACLHSEQSSARLPGFGDLLFEFVQPLFKRASSNFLRLVRAACLLHDVTWRAHPDYRAEISFDNATRANLGGIDHTGRIFLALALFNRYRNTGGNPPEGYTGLLTTEQISQAIILGKAMRFGAMFSASAAETIGRLKFRSKKHVLTLILPESFMDIFGEVVETRFLQLAKAMDCEAKVEIV
ncbi:MAG: Ppx/GppA family phosphatase [Rhodobacteraceae bacterium]|nr:Ppx/GppA family phosphatase [Paracoccaceae bacterium]